VQVHQILVDGHGIAAKTQLGIDEGAVNLALRRAQERYRESDIHVLYTLGCGSLGWHSARPAEWTCQRELCKLCCEIL
jgi:hypothetical protein